MANTEILGVGAVEKIISRTDRLEPNFSRNDKELSWDGFIYLFHHAGDKHPKKDSAGRIAVQIKGRKCSNLDDEEKSFSVDMSDIRNYLQDGGTMFFVVFITDEDEFVYYCGLLPYELRIILKKYGNQHSRTIPLEPFPKDKKDVEELVFNFARDRDLQRAAISSEMYSLEDIAKSGCLKSFSFGYTVLDKSYRTPMDYFLDHGMYLYADLPFGIKLPVEHINHIEEATTEIEQDVYVGDKLFFRRYRVNFKKDCEEICFGKCLTFVNPKDGQTGKINFKISGTLKERINSLEFMILVLQEGRVKISGQDILIFNVAADEIAEFNLPEQIAALEYLKKIQTTLDELHVKKDLDCDSMTSVDEYNLDQLVSAISDKNLIKLNNVGTPFGTYSIANIHLFVCAIKDEDSGLYRLYDILNAPIVFRGVDSEQKEFDSSICVELRGDMLLNFDNIDYDSIIRELAEIEPSEPYSQHLTLFLLEILRVYDELKLSNHPLLYLAKKVVELIQEKYTFNEPEITELNLLQITLRERPLNETEITSLNAIVSDSRNAQKYPVLTGAYILLNNQAEAKKNYLLMEEKDRKAFDDYPINRYRNWR